MKCLIYSIFATIVLSMSAPASANAFKQYYQPNQLAIDSAVRSKSKPLVYSSQNLQLDVDRALEDGYVILGLSEFVGTIQDSKQAEKFAKKIGASLVLINYRYVETVSGGTSIVMLPMLGGFGGAIGHAAPVSFEKYHQAAVFLSRVRPDKVGLGIIYRSLNSDESLKLGSSKGVFVQVVRRGSPAFDANIIPHDIVTTVAGQDISTEQRIEQLENHYAGQTVPIEVIRDDERMTLQITLPSEPRPRNTKR